jgi:hypothetical protein
MVATMASSLQRPVWTKALREQGLAEDQVQEICARMERSYPEWTEATFPGLLGNVVAGRVANRFDLHGSNYAPSQPFRPPSTNCIFDARIWSSPVAWTH